MKRSRRFSAPPDRLDYDWNGDGILDQTSTAPVLTHAYPTVGAYRPILTARRGTTTATRQHADFILILDGGGGQEIFSDGFEAGTTGRWSKTVGTAFFLLAHRISDEVPPVEAAMKSRFCQFVSQRRQ